MNPPTYSSPKQDLWAALLATASLLLGLWSFVWARRHPEFPWDGPILLLVAGGLLLLALRRNTEPASETTAGSFTFDWLPGWPSLANVSRWRIGVFGVSLLLVLSLLSRLIVPDRPSYALEVALWLLSIATFILAVAPPVRRPREDWSIWWEINRAVVLTVAAIALIALALRLWNLEGIPSTLGGDEGSQGLEAVRTITGDLRNPFTTGWLGVPTFSFFFNSLTLRLLGSTVTALRLPWAIVGTITILTTFWLVTRLRGLTLGLMTAALLAAYHYHIHFSRLGSNQIADPFFVSLALLYLYRARDRGSPLDWAMVGVTMGLAQYFYAGARLTLVVVGACLLLFFWHDRLRRDALRDVLGGALTVVGAFLVTAAPMLQYAARFPMEYNARLNQVGIIQSGWLPRASEALGLSTVELLWDQFVRAFLAFNVFPDRTVWYGLAELSPPQPLMDDVWGTLFMVGLLYTTLRLFLPNADQRFFPMVVWWWAGMLFGGMLTESPPSSQRLIVLAPPAVFFIAVVLLRTFQVVQEVWGRRDLRQIAPLLALCVLALGASSVRWYFAEYTPANVYGSQNGEIATALGRYLAANQEPDQTAVMVGPPHLYLGFGTIPYLAPRAAYGIDVHEPLVAPPSAESLGLPAGQRPLFIAIPLRAEELAWAEQAFPGGERFSVDDPNGEPLFWGYAP